MNTEKDEQAAGTEGVRVQPAELDGTALDLAVGGATLSTTTVPAGIAGRESTAKGTPVGEEGRQKGPTIPGIQNSNPG